MSLFWKGRVGLYNLLDALGVGDGDEVIVPAFTCVVVPNAILYKGAKVVFVDIDQRTLSVNPKLIIPKINAKTKVIIAQNTLGLPSDLKVLKELADQYGLILIDDCTHGLKPDPSTFDLVDAAFYSSQWNKPYSTGLGGMVYVKDPELAKRMQIREENLVPPGFLKVQMLRLQYWMRKYILSPRLYWPMVKLFRWLSAKNIVVGSSQGPELESAKMPANYNMGMSAIQCKWGIKALQKLDQKIVHRQKIADLYDAGFKEMGKKIPFRPAYAEHLFLKYPFFVKERSKFMDQAVRAKVPLGDWMLSPIHPIQKDHERWTYNYGSNPIGEALSRSVLNLPTDVSEKEAHRILAFLAQHQNDLIDTEQILI